MEAQSKPIKGAAQLPTHVCKEVAGFVDAKERHSTPLRQSSHDDHKGNVADSIPSLHRASLLVAMGISVTAMQH